MRFDASIYIVSFYSFPCFTTAFCHTGDCGEASFIRRPPSPDLLHYNQLFLNRFSQKVKDEGRTKFFLLYIKKEEEEEHKQVVKSSIFSVNDFTTCLCWFSLKTQGRLVSNTKVFRIR